MMVNWKKVGEMKMSGTGITIIFYIDGKYSCARISEIKSFLEGKRQLVNIVRAEEEE